MRKLLKPTKCELMFKNSRFISEAVPVSSPEDARTFWRKQKTVYDNGGHIVYAFITGNCGSVMGCSDDGEPSGTAGRPALAVLKGSGITNVIITITRYFGGTKLGTGGLVHAYSECAKAALENAETAEIVPQSKLTMTIPYHCYAQCRNLLEANSFEFIKEEFSDTVDICGFLPGALKDKVTHALKEICRKEITLSSEEF